MNQRCRLENADFVLVCCSDFSRVGAAVERRNSYVIVNRAWYDLYTLECTREDNNIAASCVCLKRVQKCFQNHYRVPISADRSSVTMIMRMVNKQSMSVYKSLHYSHTQLAP